MTTQSRPPETLFHYTSAAGLLGILESRQMWATHARFLNDAQELHYGLEFIRRVLATYPRSDRLTVAASVFDAGRPAFFLACFCEEGDLLSQWRAYSPGSTGYCIGFYARCFPAHKIFSVVYRPDEQEAAVRAAVAEADENPLQLDRPTLAIKLESDLLRLAIRFKHPSFDEEREWRLIEAVEDSNSGFDLSSYRAKFRPTHRFLVPYVEIPLKTTTTMPSEEEILHLASVRYGPTAHPIETRYALEWLMWRYGYSTQVLGSETPLRL